MNLNKQAYKKYTDKRAGRSPVLKNCFAAFWCGGLICALGEILRSIFISLGATIADAALYVTATLVFLAALLTGLGVFDNIARYAGAGTLVPVTGFANAVASVALDARSEGYVLGVGSKIFTVSGPVILYSTVLGTLWGIIYYVISLF